MDGIDEAEAEELSRHMLSYAMEIHAANVIDRAIKTGESEDEIAKLRQITAQGLAALDPPTQPELVKRARQRVEDGRA